MPQPQLRSEAAMSVETTGRNFYPDDPEYFIAQLARDREAVPAEPASSQSESDDACDKSDR